LRGVCWAFEKAVNAKKSQEIINKYCQVFADEISNLTNSFEEAFEDKDFFNFYHNQVIAEIQAIEYTKINNLEDLNAFVKLYVNTFISESSINRNYHDISEDINEKVLNKALFKINKLDNKF
jgi:hypothetical protein